MVINGKVINPGELRTSITLQKRTVTANSGGFPSPGWSTLATVWARWENVHGGEVWQAETVQAERAATVLIRYRSDVDTTCAVLLGSDRYQVVSMDNIQQRGEYIELKVKLWKDG
jgi:SPP1 family predicted phage head-tail adaptor